MTKNILDYVTEKTNELINAPSVSKEAKEAAQKWLAAVGTADEAEQTAAYIKELEGDIVPIDMLIQLCESEQGAKIFGEDTAKKLAVHGKDIKANGAVYCDCPACTAVEAILSKKDEILS